MQKLLGISFGSVCSNHTGVDYLFAVFADHVSGYCPVARGACGLLSLAFGFKPAPMCHGLPSVVLYSSFCISVY